MICVDKAYLDLHKKNQAWLVKAQVVIKATLFFAVMYLILEAINYYYYFGQYFGHIEVTFGPHLILT